MEAVWAYWHRAVSRQDIVQKMNYRMQRHTDEWNTGFDNGMREVLAVAITMPRTTTYAQYRERFNYEKVFEMMRYHRGHDQHLQEEREGEYPELLDLTDDNRAAKYGELSGKLATIRWLTDKNRKYAEEEFPFLDL
jgi:hypothetical protein